MHNPNNESTEKNPVGRFMVATGAVIELGTTGKILVTQRSRALDWQPDEWEILYGRMAQFETPLEGLQREAKEELGLTDLVIIDTLKVWHIYRGEKNAENELVGITFHCRTQQESITLSDEHQRYQWVSPHVAKALIQVPGIQKDIDAFIKAQE